MKEIEQVFFQIQIIILICIIALGSIVIDYGIRNEECQKITGYVPEPRIFFVGEKMWVYISNETESDEMEKEYPKIKYQ